MAFKLASLFVEIAARTTGLDSALSGVKAQLSSVGGMIAGLGPALGISLGAAGAAMALRSVVNTATGLETSFVKLAKAVDLDPAGMKGLKTEMEGLARSLKGVSYEDLISIATTGAKMGVAAEDLAAYAEGVAKVRTAMDDLPAEVIAEQIGKLNVIFDLGIDGTMQLGSAIDKLADSGISSASGILAVSQRISGTAVAARITAQETTALAAAILETGTQAELGASTIQRLIMNFAKSADPMRDMVGWLDKLQGMNFEDQLAAIDQLEFGKDSPVMAGEIIKMSLQTDNLRKYVGMANHEFRTLDQITKSYNATAVTTDALWEQTSNHLKILKDHLGLALLPTLNTTLGLVNDLSKGLSDAFSNVGPILADVSAAMGDWSDVIEVVGFGFRHLPDVFKYCAIDITEKVTNLVEMFRTIPANLQIVGEWVRDNWAALMKDGVNNVLQAFKNLGANIGALFEGIWNAAMTGEFKVDWTPMMKDFKSTVGEMKELVKPDYTDLSDQKKDILDKIKADEAGIAKKKREMAEKAKLPFIPGEGGGEKFKSVTMAADEFARKMQMAIFDSGEKKVGEDQLAEAKKQTEHLEIIRKAIVEGKLGVGAVMI